MPMTITAGREPSGATKARRRRFASPATAIIVSVALAAPLFLVGGPEFAAELSVLTARQTVERIRAGEAVDDASLAHADDSFRRAVRFTPGDGGLYTDRALIMLVRAERAGVESDDGKRLIASAVQVLETGLKKSPANGFAWARLAAARLALDGSAAASGIARALEMSYRTSPYAYKLMPVRIDVGFSIYESLDARLRAAVASDIAALWRRSWADQLRVMALACRHNRAFLVAKALRDSAEARAAFNKLYPDYLTPEGCAAKFS